MNKKYWTSVGLSSAFILWTVLVSCVDVVSIGPGGSTVGFAALNGWFHRLTGVNVPLYTLTDWLGLVPMAVGFAFALLGVFQWIRRKSLLRVDRDLLVLGDFYLVTLAVYLLFESVVINYRPVLIESYLEASYPSSTTLLTLCVMSTAAWQLRRRLRRKLLCRTLVAASMAFSVFMVFGRLLSGVHWLSDIVGGVLLSGGLVTAYQAVCLYVEE